MGSVKQLLVLAVAAFHLTVVPWGIGPKPPIPDDRFPYAIGGRISALFGISAKEKKS